MLYTPGWSHAHIWDCSFQNQIRLPFTCSTMTSFCDTLCSHSDPWIYPFVIMVKPTNKSTIIPIHKNAHECLWPCNKAVILNSKFSFTTYIGNRRCLLPRLKSMLVQCNNLQKYWNTTMNIQVICILNSVMFIF